MEHSQDRSLDRIGPEGVHTVPEEARIVLAEDMDLGPQDKVLGAGWGNPSAALADSSFAAAVVDCKAVAEPEVESLAGCQGTPLVSRHTWVWEPAVAEIRRRGEVLHPW